MEINYKSLQRCIICIDTALILPILLLDSDWITGRRAASVWYYVDHHSPYLV